ncbi:unnamed protein product [Moneuplotes crassus]|uniref:Uncharacterized protein n=1 Tax=Euplotes crassus TaxID=5936 RepID=A0AAD1X8N4_EUPCR|nr:unnamed protein product [Moneuplotes crassus]
MSSPSESTPQVTRTKKFIIDDEADESSIVRDKKEEPKTESNGNTQKLDHHDSAAPINPSISNFTSLQDKPGTPIKTSQSSKVEATAPVKPAREEEKLLKAPTPKKNEEEKTPILQKKNSSSEKSQRPPLMKKQSSNGTVPSKLNKKAQDSESESESGSGESSESESGSSRESSSSSSDDSSDSSDNEQTGQTKLKIQFKRRLKEIKEMRDKPVEERKILMKQALRKYKKDVLSLKIQGLQKKKPSAVAKKAKAKAKQMGTKKRELKQKKKQSTKSKEEKKINVGKIKKPLSRSKTKSSKNKSKSLTKEDLVSEVGARWWYVLPDWPPADHDYSDGLSKRKLRKVDDSRFKLEQEIDENGLQKVQEIECYPGCFQDSKGIIHDLRPQDSCPSINNLMKKTTSELKELAIKAIKIQLEQCDDTIREELKEKLEKLSK